MLKSPGSLFDTGLEPVHDIGTNIPAATDRDGIAEAQQLVGAGDLVLDGAGVSGGSYAAGFDGGRKITLYSAGNLSARTFTVTGTDKDGAAQTENLTGPNNSTVTGTKYFQTVTQIAVNGAVGSDVEAGFAASLVVLNTSRAKQFILAPANGETLVVAIYPNPVAGISTRVQLRLIVPASLTLTWADGTTPADTKINWPDANVAPTINGGTTAWFEFDGDGATDSGDYVWQGFTADTVSNLLTLYEPRARTLRTVTDANGTLAATDSTLLFSTGNTNRTCALPAMSSVLGQVFTICKIDSGTGMVTINRDGTDTIEGDTSVQLVNQWDKVTLQATATGWIAVS